MNDTQKQALLSALRSVAITIGGILVAHGYLNDNTLNQVIGIGSVLIPALWGIVEKYQAESKTVARVNDAVAVATDMTNTKGPS